MRFEDFVIQFGERTNEGYPIHVTTSPAGEASGYFSLPFNGPELYASLAELARRETAQRDSTYGTQAWYRELGEQAVPVLLTPRQIGESLYGALFRSDINSRLDQSLGKIAAKPGGGMRLILKLNPTHPDLAMLFSLPWELLFRPDSQDFFSLSRATPIVRYLDVPRPAAPLALPDYLQILVVAAEVGGPPLDLAQEQYNLMQTWADHPFVKVEFLKRPRLADLRRRLLENPCHVLHFMGHGSFDRNTGEGQLYFEDESGMPTAVSGHTLATHLKDIGGLRLIFLNACRSGESAYQQGLNPFAGVAGALILGGFPAVLAMQFPISDRVAIAFSQAFYQRLAAGDPVECAVTEGRLAIHSLDERGTEWGTPILFSRVPSGKIFLASPKTQLGITAKDWPQNQSAFKYASRPAQSRQFEALPSPQMLEVKKPRFSRIIFLLLGLAIVVWLVMNQKPWLAFRATDQTEYAMNPVESLSLKKGDGDTSTEKKGHPRPEQVHDPGEKRVVGLPGGASMTMVWIPPGVFTMGSPPDEPGRSPDETPFTVTLSRGFWISSTEVTQDQYQSVTRTNPSKVKGAQKPVTNITWTMAQNFVLELNAETDAMTFSLPTEAQWEYACRAGTRGRFAGDLFELAWYRDNSGSQVQTVGQKIPNAWGVHDMHGNVWEWCADWKGAYPSGRVTDPVGPRRGSFKAARGGGFDDKTYFCRSANRTGLAYQSRAARIGFRPVMVDR